MMHRVRKALAVARLQQAFTCAPTILLVLVPLLGTDFAVAKGERSSAAVKLVSPTGLALDQAGDLYITDIGTHYILKRDKAGTLTVIAGAGRGGFGGDGGPATAAVLHAPHDVVVDDSNGRVLIADTYNHRIRSIDRNGMIATVAGNRRAEYSGDGGPAAAAALNNPQGIALDRDGNLLIADTYNHVVRRVDRNGVITTIAGSTAGLSGDGGPATKAQLSLPMAVAAAPDGSVYISDAGNSRIRRVSAEGTIETIAGHGPGSGLAGAGFEGDGRPATRAKLFSAADVEVGRGGNLYISDSGNHRVRVVLYGIITTVAGGEAGFGGDGGSALSVAFHTPQKIAVGTDGSIYIADRANHRVRLVDPAGNIRSVAGESESARSIVSVASGGVQRDNLLDTRQIVSGDPIDEHVFGALRRDKIPHAPPSGDYEFLRRVSLDLTGRIPTPQQVNAFVTDPAVDKRERLIDELLSSPAWVDHWSYWYGDLFRNCANRVGNATTKHFDAWLRKSLKEDKPYDQLVTELLTASAPNTAWMPDAAPAGYLARWHVSGELMYSDRYEDTADEIAVQSARFFLGINLQCISCHGGRGFLEKVDLGLVDKARKDLWAMAAFFGNTRVRIVPFQDRFTISEDGAGYDTAATSSVRLLREGGAVEPAFLLTGEKADLTRPLRPQFARMLTSHPQFARATANLIWKQFFGQGIVEPVDGFDMARQDPSSPPPAPWTVQPKNPELLDALAREFAAGGFRLKHLMRIIARSSAYQLSSRFDGKWEERFELYFARHHVRPLTAEQMHDAICQATQVFGDYPQSDMLYGRPLAPIRFVTEAPTPEEIQSGEARMFLRTFGQANREQSDRQPGGSILQAISLMNSEFVTRRVRAAGGSTVDQLVKSGRSSAEIVDELFLWTLSRPPLASERELAVKWLDEDRRQGAEDLQWSLLNKLDFVFNH